MHFVQAKGLLSKDNGINIYRGCSHGCIYCDSRSKCYGFTHRFEDIEAKVKGIIFFGIGVTLREGDREYFYHALDRHFPGMKQKYISTYGNSYNLPSLNEKKLVELIRSECKKAGIMCTVEDCFSYLHELPEKYVQ
ncbi:MAG: hypothetical protein IJA10_09785 [Lachnospiraceae bacterium]|nr:hypothetical protein [Lachnospiraceae bacterium]